MKLNSDASVKWNKDRFFYITVESISISNRMTYFMKNEHWLIDTGNTYTQIPSG